MKGKPDASPSCDERLSIMLFSKEPGCSFVSFDQTNKSFAVLTF